jgi:HemY protein
MAGIEAGETGDKGKVREWLARAANAARDPVWFADGVISNRWEPVSPVDGRLDAFQWRVPVETRDQTSADLVASRIEELLAISGPEANSDEPSQRPSSADVIDAEAVTVAPSRTVHGPDVTEAANAPVATVVASVPALPVAVKDTTATPVTRPQPNGKAEAKIFVAPHAPDDPGLEDGEAEDVPPYAKRPFRAVK